MSKSTKWINTEGATIDRAKELLANRIANLPIYVRWYRMEYGGNTGTPFGMVGQYSTYLLIGVTEKRLKVTPIGGGSITMANPRKCFFATREER